MGGIEARYPPISSGPKNKTASLDGLIQKAQTLIKKYPDAPAAARVKELLPVE